MDDNELEALLSDLESDRVERKASASERSRIREAICAFANDLPNHRAPGVILIGANDDGSCAGLSVTDELLRTLADMRSDGNITPFPSMTVQKRVLRGCELAVIIVQPSDSPPVRYKGRVCVRVGPRRAQATDADERRLAEKRRAGDLPFDVRPLPSASIDDLDLDSFLRDYLPSAVPADVLERNARPIEHQLVSLRFAAAGSPPIPTVLGMLVVGKDTARYTPGAYIQFLRIEGVEFAANAIANQKRMGGCLIDVLQRLDDVLEANVSIATDLTSSRLEIQHPDYPLAALQQITRNAVLHRTYEGTHAPTRITWFADRVEIQSPGGPFGQVNRDNFGQPGVADYRNPHLAEVMRNLGYVQQFGVGIDVARRELQHNGNPPLEFRVEDTHILAVIRRRP